MGVEVQQWCCLLRRNKMANRKTFDIGRDAKTGRLITVKEAKSRPNTTVVERMPKPGRGDTKK